MYGGVFYGNGFISIKRAIKPLLLPYQQEKKKEKKRRSITPYF